jgi:hypothetical protein
MPPVLVKNDLYLHFCSDSTLLCLYGLTALGLSGPSIAPTFDEGIQISRKRAGFHVIKRTAE